MRQNVSKQLSMWNSELFRLTAKFGQNKIGLYASYIPRLLARSLRPQMGKFRLSTYGVWLTSKPGDLTFDMCVDGSYGPFYFDYIANLPRCTFLDIGSNIGLYSLIAHRNREIANIYSFEPNPEINAYLVENLVFNGCARVIPIVKAISSSSGVFVLKTFSGHSGKSSLREDIKTEVPDGEMKIETANEKLLDDLLADNTDPVAIKIDVEGHELVVLETLRRSKLWPRVFSLFFEVDERYLDLEKVLELLDTSGFSRKAKIGDKVHYDLLYERRGDLVEK